MSYFHSVPHFNGDWVELAMAKYFRAHQMGIMLQVSFMSTKILFGWGTSFLILWMHVEGTAYLCFKLAFNASTPALAQALFMCVVQIFCWNGMEANRNNTNWNEWKKFSRLPNFEQVEGDRMAWAESNSDTCCINWQGNTRGKKHWGVQWCRI